VASHISGGKFHHSLNQVLSSGILALPPNTDVATPLATPNCCS